MPISPYTREPESDDSDRTERRLKITLWLVAASFLMQSLDTTIVNTALPVMARTFGEQPLHMQPVVVAYSLAMALTIPLSGFLSDRMGTRRVFLWAMIIFTAASYLCASAQTLSQLVVFRIIQGIGGGMLSPVGRLALLHSFSRERLLPALGFVAIPGMIGPLVGPAIGGWLVEVASWHWIFLINAPVGIVGCILSYTQMLDSKVIKSRAPFDTRGYALMSLGMLTMTVALDTSSEIESSPLIALGLLSLTVFCVLLYILHAKKALHPLFSPALFRIPAFRVGLSGNLFARVGCGGLPYLLPLVQQTSLNYTPIQAGLMMLPVAGAGMVSRRLAVALIRKFNYRVVLVGNTIVVGASISSFALLSPSQPIVIHVFLFMLFGMANAIQFTAMNSFTLKDLSGRRASAGNSLFSLTQMLSMSLGVTVASAVMVQMSRLVGMHGATGLLTCFHATFAVLGVLTALSAFVFVAGA